MKANKAILYTAGFITGAGVLAVGGGFAVDSAVPYTFEDGQVISADVMNDMFSKIRNTTVGFESANDLVGVWSCTQYDVPLNGDAPMNGQPNQYFQQDGTTRIYSATNTWTFSNSGTMLNVTKFLVGSMGAAYNRVGTCPLNTGISSFDYSVTLAEGYLLLGQKNMGSGCLTEPVALPIQKASPYKFKYTVPTGFGVCISQTQPPAIPTGLSISGNTLSWTDTSSDETAFVIMKKSAGGSWSELATVGAGVTSYTDPNKATGDKYRVKSRNSNADSLGSNVVKIL
jgi:hypothetical protein